MKYDRLEQARADLEQVRRQHGTTVTRAAADVRASKERLAAAEKSVRDMEFAVVECEIDAERVRSERGGQ
jgi:hypothetical protein